MDDLGNTDSSMAAGAGEQLHDGRVRSPPAGDCRCPGAGQDHPGAANKLASRRREAETALKESGKQQTGLLADARLLLRLLRRQARGSLSAQEDERLKTSRHLRDEFAMPLLNWL